MSELAKRDSAAVAKPKSRKVARAKVKQSNPEPNGLSPDALAIVKQVTDKAEAEGELVAQIVTNYDKVLGAVVDRKIAEAAPAMAEFRRQEQHDREQRSLRNQTECKQFVTDFFDKYGLEVG